MLVIGGTFPLDDQCDSATTWGVHNLDMGKLSGKQWNIYQTNITTYYVPPDIYSVVGGSSMGGATSTVPINGFANRDLSVYFSQKASAVTRTPTRAIPVATSSSSSTASATASSTVKLSGAAIAGIAVGGAIFLSSLILGTCFLIRQKRKRQLPPPLVIQKSAPEYSQTPFSPQSQYSHAVTFKSIQHYQLPTSPEPVELYGSAYKRATKETYHTLRHGPGSPTSTYSDSGTKFSRSNTVYGGSPPTPVYHNQPPPVPPPPPNHF